MNPLGNGNIVGITPQMRQGIQQVKGLIQMASGNPMALVQQNPQLAQVMQMCQGQNPEQVFYAMCKQRGIDANAFLQELRG